MEENRMNLNTKDRKTMGGPERLFRVARQDTGQARRVAAFLLAWHNADENGRLGPC